MTLEGWKTRPLKRPRLGFTLVEMLLATTLAAILTGAVLTATAAVSRDRRRMELAEPAARSTLAFEMIRRDLANAAAIVGRPGANGFELVGHGGLDARTFAPNNRLAHVSYRVDLRTGVLTREQAYLDEPVRRDVWRETVALNVRGINLTPTSADAEGVVLGEEVELRVLGGRAGRVPAARAPSRVRVRIDYADGVADREVVVR